jgi:uncharacterized repeat protein (TIGR01451 family)
MTKSDGGITAMPGQIITYTLRYANLSAGLAVGVVITETVPENTIFAGPVALWPNCAFGAPAGTICNHTINTVAGNEDGTVAFAVQVVPQVPAGVSQIENVARIGSPTQANAHRSSETTPLIATPDLALQKSDGGTTVRPGETLIFTLRYANNGNQDATGVFLTETIPANTAFQPAQSTPGWSCLNESCTLTIGDLAAGAQGTADFAVIVASTMPAGVMAITNSATIDDDHTNGEDSNPADNNAEDTTPVIVDLTLAATKSAALVIDENTDGQANPDDTLEYRVQINNTGTGTLTGVRFSDTVDPNTQVDADSTTTTHGVVTRSTSDTVQVAVGDLPAGQSAEIVFRVRIRNPFPANIIEVTNQGLVESNETPAVATDDPTVSGANNRTRTPVRAMPVLKVTKSDLLYVDVDGDGLVDAGDQIYYRLRIVNEGNQEAASILLKDVPDSATTLVVGSVRLLVAASRTENQQILRGNQSGDSEVEVAIGALAVGARAEVSFVTTIKPGSTFRQIRNQAFLYHEQGGKLFEIPSDDPETPLSDDATETIISQPAPPLFEIDLYMPLINRR